MIQAALEALVQRPGSAPAAAPPGLRDALPDLKAGRVWEGTWDTLDSVASVSVETPAVLVSFVDLDVVHLGRTTADRLRLAPTTAAGAPVSLPPAPRALEALSRPTYLVQIAVVLLSAVPGAADRASGLVDLAEQALPVLVDHALTDIVGTNLDSEALRKLGLSAILLVGNREFERVPAASPARALPSRVDVRRGLATETIYPEPEC